MHLADSLNPDVKAASLLWSHTTTNHAWLCTIHVTLLLALDKRTVAAVTTMFMTMLCVCADDAFFLIYIYLVVSK